MTTITWNRRGRTAGIVAAALVASGALAATASAAIPHNVTPPAITGTPREGQTLTASRGTWENDPTSFSYRWRRCSAAGDACTTIAGATRRTYTLTAPDVDHTIRVVVTATNADGSESAASKPTDIVSANDAPRNTSRPTISGTPMAGEELTADPGTWTGGVTSFAYQWQRCDGSGANCTDVTGATGRTYGVRAADVGHTLRVAVTAKNAAGSATATSDRTNVVTSSASPPPPPPPPAPDVNRAPSIRILGVRFVGVRAYIRLRACDDSRGNLRITERDSKRGVRAYTRHWRTLVPPRPCQTLRRSFRPAPRFRHGRYTITVWARDRLGKTSRPAHRTFLRR